MTDPVSLLRQAADKLETLSAGVAPWSSTVQVVSTLDLDDAVEYNLLSVDHASIRAFLTSSARDAHWIATLHPGIAKPLAAWLRQEADDAERNCAQTLASIYVLACRHAVDLARAILHTEGTNDR